jgi:hypothetical protein
VPPSLEGLLLAAPSFALFSGDAELHPVETMSTLKANTKTLDSMAVLIGTSASHAGVERRTGMATRQGEQGMRQMRSKKSRVSAQAPRQGVGAA